MRLISRIVILASTVGSSFSFVPASKRSSTSGWISPKSRQNVDGLMASNSDDFDVVSVDLEEGRDYPIYIGAEFDPTEAGKMLRSHVKGKRVLVVTNDKLAPLYLEKYEAMLKEGGELQVDTLVLPDGEEKKTMDVMMKVLDKCLELKLDRKVTFVALGGGVIGDMVGFAAAIYQRGVNFIQVPTTVMAMVDSSVGGKTAVNHPLGKNMIGCFHQPECVFVDTDTLKTLPDRELQSGIAEVIKYGLIRDDEFFEWQEKNMEALLNRDPAALRYAIKRSCENKAEVVKADEKEAGIRATLNLGHTFGHAIENGSGYGVWLHGEAVAIGTAMAATMSARMGWIEEDLVKRIYNILHAANLPTELPVDSPMTAETFLDAMSVDKKVADGQLRLILLKGALGNCVFTGDFDRDAMTETIDEFVAECAGSKATV
uniref:3-dehydroquinate synthase, chloroplastic n=1 Tax=Pseudictyota dubia TaxID=2749911 RepID=A0A7R9YWX5_9STRA|mmetsp:Transcript_10911/g.20807  ORF Transcript_10911/g.20807 Transcript_10911/m.20807 type:complete len:429 (+) Transcript_10911:129-1415(+)